MFAEQIESRQSEGGWGRGGCLIDGEFAQIQEGEFYLCGQMQHLQSGFVFLRLES